MDGLVQPPPLSSGRSPRRAGRPRKTEGPRVNYAELDQLLVFGEPLDGPGQAVRYPAYRELAARYGVASSVIADYARKNRCQKRRKANAARIRARVEEKRRELRADAIARGFPEVVVAATEALKDARRDVIEEITSSPDEAA